LAGVNTTISGVAKIKRKTRKFTAQPSIGKNGDPDHLSPVKIDLLRTELI
jgi:hypothetical protein